MKKVAESCPSPSKAEAGNTSETGNSILGRTVLNTPSNEGRLRGTLEGLEAYRKRNLNIIPLPVLKSVLEAQGVEFVDENGAVV